MPPRKSPLKPTMQDETGPLEDVEAAPLSWDEGDGIDAGPMPDPDDIAGPGDYDQETNDDLLDGVPICSRAEFRTWYAGRFHLANMILAPFLGGPLQALDLDENNAMVQRAADGLYDEAKRRKWRFLIKKPSGTWPMIETQGGLFFAVISEAAAEVATRRAEAQAKAQGVETETTGPGKATTQEDFDRARAAQPRDEKGNRVFS